MLDRLVGLESEYAIRFSSRSGAPRPGNDRIYASIIDALHELVRVRKARKIGGVDSVFVENGGSVCYEVLPKAPGGGLLEGGTPECRGPGEVVLYQRAQDRLLLQAVRDAKKTGAFGHDGDVGLVRNCRDACGHIYGAQENYEVDIARGGWLLLYRAGLATLAPYLAVFTLLTWAYVILFLLAVLSVGLLLLCGALVGLVIPPFGRWLDRTVTNASGERVIARVSSVGDRMLGWPLATPFALLLQLCAFRHVRRSALPFLVSRCVVTGAGTVEDDGRFGLSEKAPSVRRPMRLHGGLASRSILDTANLVKAFCGPCWFHFHAFRRLFAKRQRLQIGMSDANPAQVAEYLKVGTTCLVLDMEEAGYLDDAPRLRHPVAALHRWCTDPTLRAEVDDGRRTWSALAMQRWYLERARRFVRESSAPALEAHDVIRLWGECLDGLERDPGELVGRLDWVTKRWLVEDAAADAPRDVRKKVDIKYHELGDGYFARLEAEGLTLRLVSDEEIDRAMTEPPERTPARLRGRLIRELADDVTVRVGWDSVRIGGPIRGRVIRLDDYR